MMNMFCSRIIWKEFNIPKKVIENKFKDYFGSKKLDIENRKEAIKVLIGVTNRIQSEMVDKILKDESYFVIKNLYAVLNESSLFYMIQKEMRNDLINLNAQSVAITDVLEQNRNICRNIIDATNLWIENYVLLQNCNKNIDGTIKFDPMVMVDMYVYGLASQAISLLQLSKKFDDKELYYGISINYDEDIPIEILKYKPIIYFNTLMTGNQNVLSPIPITKESNKTEFGIGFNKQFNVDFILYLRLISTFQANELRNDKSGVLIVDKQRFIDLIESYTNNQIKGDDIIKNFTLTKNRVKSQLNGRDPIIWTIGVNKIRHELCPFVLLENNMLIFTYSGLEQSKQLWVSILSNGGSVYSNCVDYLKVAVEKRNDELSHILVDKIREKLRKHYYATFDVIEVKYHKIYGYRDIDYGDFDLIFYTEKTRELFLIEAKYFSDSLNCSGIVNDHEKMFKDDGYYFKCRRRYDIVLDEVDKIKSFIGVEGDIKVHLLFISSKPLELEFQDDDKVVTFLCLNIFEKYLNGKLIDDNDEVVRPTHLI
ncbi:hypothetical protein [Clostridium carnis]